MSSDAGRIRSTVLLVTVAVALGVAGVVYLIREGDHDSDEPSIARTEQARDEVDVTEPAPVESAPPQVDLDTLLQLPDPGSYDMERRGGSTRGEWRIRFQEARAEIEGAERALASAQKELEQVASSSPGQWTFTAPGLQNQAPSEAPLDYYLMQEIKRWRAEKERAEKALADLIVEANLAGVPDEWRE